MAITSGGLLETGQTATPGQRGSVIQRLILDGSATTFAVTLPSTHHIKRIRAVVGCTVAANGIGAAGVAATTGFTATVAAGTNGHAQDILIIGDGAL